MKPMAFFSAPASCWKYAAACAVAAGALLAGAPAQADSYPNKPVRIIVPFPPGGGTDAMARMFADRLGRAMGQPFVIDNRAGATGTIGTNAVAAAVPDGYTLLVGSFSSHVLAPLTLEGDAKVADPVKDFAPIGMLAYHPMVLNVHPSVKAGTVGELVAETKQRPMFYASIGNGSLFHFAGAEFNQLTGAAATHVPYRGAAPALADLLGGQVHMMFDTIQSSLPHIRKGSLKPIAVTGAARSPLLPDVPTLAEAGLAGYDVTSWVGMLAPAGTPPEIVVRLAAELDKLAQDREFVAQAAKTGTDIPRTTPAAFREILVKDQQKYKAQFNKINLAK